MARKVFYSFHFANDFWRTQQVRNINALEGQTLAAPNVWEEVKQKGDAAVHKWIDGSLVGKSCVIVLVGKETSKRKFVTYEISEGWNKGKGVVAILVNKLLDKDGNPGVAGSNPLLGTVGSFVLRPSASLSDEPFAEHDGELGPGLEPFARRPLPLVGLAIEDQI